MSDTDVVGVLFDGDHRHDWRVNPAQVIITVADKHRLEVVCAGCGRSGHVYSAPNPPVSTRDIGTWRPYRFKQGDHFVLDRYQGPGAGSA